MDKIGDLISNKKGRSAMMKSVQAAMIVEFFNQLIKSNWGQAIGDQAQAKYLKNQILTVACRSSAMAHKIHLNERQFINDLNQKFGPQTVIKIQYMV